MGAEEGVSVGGLLPTAYRLRPTMLRCRL